jgi:endonuclease G, mitochondrial
MRKNHCKLQMNGVSAMLVLSLLTFSFSKIKSNASSMSDNRIETSMSIQNSLNSKSLVPSKLEIPAPMLSCPEQILYRRGYTTSYNTENKIPNWVAWHLTKTHCSGPYKRGGIKFHQDFDIAEEKRAGGRDYYKSGFDRGRMCPAGDNKWDALSLQQSFLFTNVCPQKHTLNRGGWRKTEKICRKWAKRFGDIYIVSGPIFYSQKHKTIGSNNVAVPEAFFKVILCLRGTPKAIGFIYKNTKSNHPLSFYVNTVDQVERVTGIDFFPELPDDIENKVEAKCNLSDWLY